MVDSMTGNTMVECDFEIVITIFVILKITLSVII